jgi:pyruvate dehydrogenase E2 component (dihydrolipoamide acetyltransferase)
LTVKEITVPDIGGASDVVVIEILVKSGDTLAAETPIVTLESDKATMEVPTSVAGKVKQVAVKVGDKVSAGATLMTLDTEEKIKEIKENKHETKEVKKETLTSPAPAEAEEKPLPTQDDHIHAGPGARRLAREVGIDLANIAGTGPKQRILKEDVQAYVKQRMNSGNSGNSAAGVTGPVFNLPVVDHAKFGPIEKKALSRLKKISGTNLQRNWAMIPHVTQFGQADITELENFRQSQKEVFEKQQIRLTPLVFIMKAVVAALKAFPNFNASLDPNGEQLIVKSYFHIGVAVDTPDGLVVPVIRDVDKRGLIELAEELAVMSQKARKKQLTPLDMQGGSFSISSLGGIGGTAFTPIVNYPEVAILGLSKTSYQPVYQSGQFVPRLMLPLSLSYDHRVIDGAEGARFIMHLTHTLSDIRNLLL